MNASNRVKFTKNFLDGVTIGRPREDYYDTECDHLALMVLKSNTKTSNTKTFYFVMKVNGEVRRKKLGRWPSMTLDTVRRLARKKTAEYDEWRAGGFKGKDPAEPEPKPEAGVTVGQLFEDYVKTRIKTKLRNAAQAEQTRRYLYSCGIEALKDKSLNSLNETHALDIFNAINAQKKYCLANRVIQLLKTMLLFAGKFPSRYHYIGGDITGAIEMNPLRDRTEYITAELKPKFLAALADEDGTTLGDLIRLAILTGARKSDLFSVKWCDIKWDRKVWQLAHPKSKDPFFSYDIALVPEAIEILERRRDACLHDVWIFPNPNSDSGHVSREIWWQWDAFRKRAGLPETFVWHCLRHTCASWMAEKGKPLQAIKEALGHSKIQTTERYSHLGRQPVADALETTMADAFKIEPAKPRIVRRKRA